MTCTGMSRCVVVFLQVINDNKPHGGTKQSQGTDNGNKALDCHSQGVAYVGTLKDMRVEQCDCAWGVSGTRSIDPSVLKASATN